MAPDTRRKARRIPARIASGLRRRGLSLLEVQVAFAVLGVGLVGMCQLAVVQLRQVRKLERRLEGEVVQSSSGGTSQVMLRGQTYYLVPWQNPWARKVTGAAQIVNGAASISCDPGMLTLPSPAPPAYPVNVVEVDAHPASQTVTAFVDVSGP